MRQVSIDLDFAPPPGLAWLMSTVNNKRSAAGRVLLSVSGCWLQLQLGTLAKGS